MAPLTTSTAGALLLMRDLIHERLGIYFDESRLDLMAEKLEDTLRRRQCSSLMEYYYHLKYDDHEGEEIKHVMDALSVQETYFWREMSQVDALVKVIVPQWFRIHSIPLRIWSAACASGEEPYTIAMALEEAGYGDHPIHIYGSDASAAALAKARQGVFRERSFRALPQELRAKYFEIVPQGSRLAPRIMGRVQFRQANLMAAQELRDLATAPVVFCRNVFIYFSPEAIRRTVTSFAKNMPRHSHLFVGASESLVKLTTDFDLQEIETAFAYVRRDNGKGFAA